MAENKNVDRAYKSRYYNKNRKLKPFIEPGLKGFMVTCNFREKDCIREAYNILNQYYKDLDVVQPETETSNKEELDDIADELSNVIKSVKTNSGYSQNKYRFQAVETGAANCLFISTTIDNPVDLAMKIIKDIAESKKQETRFLLRLVPIECICRANTLDITNAAGILFDQYFLKEPKTFSIVFNRRYNNSVSRDDIIKTLADLIGQKNALNKADLKNAQLCVIVEVIKGLCLLSVVPDYFHFKKFNLVELSQKPKAKEEPIEISHEKIEMDTEKIDTDTIKIETETEKIQTNTEKIQTNSEKIEMDTEKIDTHTITIDTETEKIQTNSEKIEMDTEKIETDAEKTEDAEKEK